MNWWREQLVSWSWPAIVTYTVSLFNVVLALVVYRRQRLDRREDLRPFLVVSMPIEDPGRYHESPLVIQNVGVTAATNIKFVTPELINWVGKSPLPETSTIPVLPAGESFERRFEMNVYPNNTFYEWMTGGVPEYQEVRVTYTDVSGRNEYRSATTVRFGPYPQYSHNAVSEEDFKSLGYESWKDLPAHERDKLLHSALDALIEDSPEYKEFLPYPSADNPNKVWPHLLGWHYLNSLEEPRVIAFFDYPDGRVHLAAEGWHLASAFLFVTIKIMEYEKSHPVNRRKTPNGGLHFSWDQGG